MGSPPDEGWVVFEVAAEVAGEEGGLGKGDEAEGDGFAGVGVGEGGFLAFLPGGEEGFAGGVGEAMGVGGVDVEVFGGDLATVEEGDGVAVGDEGAELFHEVEGEGWAAGAVAVEEAELGVEAGGEEGGGAVVGKEGVEEGEEGVCGVGGWAADATGEGDAGGDEEVAVDGEGVGGGVALDAAECFEGRGRRGGEGAEVMGEAVGGLGEGGGGLRAFAGTAAEEETGVGNLAGKETGGEASGGRGVGAEGVLSAAEEDVAFGAAADPGEEGAVLGEAGDGDAVADAVAHEEGGEGDVAEGDDSAAEEVDGEEFFASVCAELEAFAFLGEPGALGEDVEGVEVGDHSARARRR